MKKAKRVLSVLLVCCLVAGMLAGTVLADGHHPFTDVPDDAWYSGAVQYVYEHGLMNGTGTTEFSPDATTSRGMIVTILHRLEGVPAAEGPAFADVPDGQYYTDGVAWAGANEIVGGYGNGKFGPDDPITREQFAVILYRYAKYKGYDVTASGDLAAFPDGKDVSSWAVEAMGWAVGTGLITGTDNNMLSPAGSAIRAQAATILMRFCENIVPATYSVTFDLNYDGADDPAVVTVEEGKTVAAPASPSRGEYTFDGWYTAEVGGNKFDFTTPITADLVLFAHWTAIRTDDDVYLPFAPSTSKSFAVAFDMNDGSAELFDLQSVKQDQTALRPGTDPTRNLYAFTGWYLEPAAVTPYDFSAPVVSDITLYAGWGDPNGSTDSIYAASDETETIYSISDITVSGSDVIVTYNTNDVALVVVEFFPDEMTDGEWTEENLNKNLALDPIAAASGYTEQYGELVTITLPISGTLPEHYLVRASLLDAGHSSVNNALATYVTARYTGTYSRFALQTVEDFDDNLVINFDEDVTTNFGVLKDSVIVIPSGCQFANNKELVVQDINVAQIDMGGDEYEPQMENLVPDHLFTFPDKTAVISTGEGGASLTLEDLEEGDIIYIEGTTWMFKIKTATINEDGSISFTQDKDTSLDDFYDVLKVDFEGVESEDSGVMPIWEIIDVDASGSVGLGPFTIENEFSSGVKLSGSISGKVKGEVTMSYDAHMFSSDYFEATLTFSTEITGEVKAEVSNNNDNEYKNVVFQVDTRKVKLPTPVTGLEIYIKPAAQINWKLTGDVSITWSSKQISGFEYNTDTGRTDIKKKENTVSVMAKGKAEAKIGPIIDIGIELLDGVLSGGVVAEAGAKFTAEATVHVDDDLTNTAEFKHACGLCVSGRADWYAAATARVGYKITKHFKGDIVQAQILDFSSPIKFGSFSGKFFVSVINSINSPFGGHLKFGGGDCTNKTYRTEFITQDRNGQDVDGVQVSVVKQGQADTKTGVSPYVVYLYEGKYNASATIGGSSVSKIVAVSDNRQTVVLAEETADTVIEGTVVNADDHRAISGATIKVKQGNVVVASAVTDSNGKFSLPVPNGSLIVQVSKATYVPFSGNVTVYEGDPTHSMGRIELAPGKGMGGLRGVIRDAVTNEALEGVKLSLYEGWNSPAAPNTSIMMFTTNSDGEFRFDTGTLFGKVVGLPSGNYTLTASKEGYSDTSYNIVVYPGTTDENAEINETMSPEMDEGFYRIVLTWGLFPEDLDSHLVAKADTGSSIHVFFGDMEPSPFYADLDIDVIESYGPETITITNFEGLSNIRYAVHDFTNREQTRSRFLSNSGAVVRLYKGNRLLRTFNVPTGYEGTEWDVFALDSTGRIRVINTMTYTNDPESVLDGIQRMSINHEDISLKDNESSKVS